MKRIVLLHGAIGSSDQLNPLAETLNKEGFQTFTFNFSGHGKTPFQNNFDINTFALELKLFIENKNLHKASVFGYSMGGYVALYLAKLAPELLGNIITLGTKFNWTKEIAEREIQNLNPETILQKVPKFALALEQRHGQNWKTLLEKTAEMMTGLGEKNVLNLSDFTAIKNNILIGLADKDSMVSLEETINVYKHLPNAAMYMLPNTKHPIESVNIKLLTQILDNFITTT
jgi:esterase/lipase